MFEKRLTIGFAAVLYGEDFNRIAEVMEGYTVVADAKTKLGRFYILETLDVSYSSSDVTSQSVQDSKSCVLVDGPEVRSGRICPSDRLSHAYWLESQGSEWRSPHLFKILVGEAEFGKYFLIRNAAIVFYPLLGGGYIPGLFFADLLVLIRRIGNGAINRVNHNLQQANYCRNLVGRYPVDQFMREFPGICRRHRVTFYLRLSSGRLLTRAIRWPVFRRSPR